MCNIYQLVYNMTIIIAIMLFEPSCILGPSVVFKNIISFYSQNNLIGVGLPHPPAQFYKQGNRE